MNKYGLTILFAVLTVLLGLASRFSSRFRAALSRDRIIAVETDDGVSYHWTIQNRSIAGAKRRTSEAGIRLRFMSASQALRIFLSPKGVGRIVNGVLDGTIQYEGNLVLLLWFDGRTQQVVPRREPFRKPISYPGAYVLPLENTEASARITRETPQRQLDPAWTAAWRQREKLLMMRVAAGEESPEL